MPRRRLLGLAAAALLPAPTLAQRPVRIVVPFAPGAGTDAMGRLLAHKLGEALGDSFVVDNRTGASGAIGAAHVAQSPADGHTLLLVAAPFTTVPAVLPTAGYDPVLGFAPISLVAQGPLVWACHKDLPVHNLAELVAYARGRPGQLNYGSAGNGGINHLLLEQLKARQRLSIVHIPYRGIAPATQDLVAGQVQLLTGTIPALAPFIRDGRIKALAVTTAQRSSSLPEVPGLAEQGLGELGALNYFGLVAPRGTPASELERITQALPAITAQAEVQARFRSEALQAAPLGAQHMAQFLRRDLEAWKKVVADQGLRIEQL